MNQYTCVHFNGIQNKACEAGCFYDAVRHMEDEFLPCLVLTRDVAKTNPAGFDRSSYCEKWKLPTPEQLADEQRNIDAMTKRMTACLPVMASLKRDNKGKNWSGVVECPVCAGKLHVSIAGAYNGHTRGHCETKDCVGWIE